MRFFVTFGQKYRHDPHPSQPWLHPDGWLEVEATSEKSARDMLDNLLGDDGWSNISLEHMFKLGTHHKPLDYYPKGRLATLREVVSGPGILVETADGGGEEGG